MNLFFLPIWVLFVFFHSFSYQWDVVSPDEGSFKCIPDEVLKQIFNYVDVAAFKEFISRPCHHQVEVYTDEEVKKSFLPIANFHLVNTRFKDVFLPMCAEVIKTEVIKTAYEKNNYFPYQRYSFAYPDLKKEINQAYHEANVLQFKAFVDDPINYEKDYTVAKLDFFMQPHYTSLFRSIDPFYRLSYTDFERWFKDEKNDSRFVNLIKKYIPVYREVFSQSEEAQDFNLFTLIALALVSEGKETIVYYKVHDRIKLLTLFYQFFLHGPFPEKAKHFFLKKFIYQAYDFSNMSLKAAFTNSHLIEDDAPVVYGYLCHPHLLFRTCARTLLKDCLLCLSDQENFLPKRDFEIDKVFLIRLYILIFDLGNNKDLQDDFKNDFMRFFKKYDCQDYVTAIEAVRKKDFDCWTVFQFLSKVVDYDLLENFLAIYNPDEITQKQLKTIKQFSLRPLTFLDRPEMKAFFTDLKTYSFDEEFLKQHPCCLYFINLFDTNIEQGGDKDLERSMLFLNKIVFSIAEKTGLKHEDIAKTLNIENYSNFYRKILVRGGTRDSLSSHALMIKPFFEGTDAVVNPLYCFSDETFLFEKIFVLDSRVYSEIQAIVLQKILKNKGCYKKLELDQAESLIKKVVLLDKNKYKDAEKASRFNLSRERWYVECLPFLIEQSDALKNLVAKDKMLVKDIDHVLEQLETWLYENRYDLPRWQSTRAFLSNFLPERISHFKEEITLAGRHILVDTRPRIIRQEGNGDQPTPPRSFLQWVKQQYRNSHFLSKLLIGFVKVVNIIHKLIFLNAY